jgi:hypothetical protein
MPFNIESHFHILLNYLLTQERNHFLEQFAIQSEQELQQFIPDPSVQHIWKSARIICLAYEAGFITIKGN